MVQKVSTRNVDVISLPSNAIALAANKGHHNYNKEIVHTKMRLIKEDHIAQTMTTDKPRHNAGNCYS